MHGGDCSQSQAVIILQQSQHKCEMCEHWGSLLIPDNRDMLRMWNIRRYL